LRGGTHRRKNQKPKRAANIPVYEREQRRGETARIPAFANVVHRTQRAHARVAGAGPSHQQFTHNQNTPENQG